MFVQKSEESVGIGLDRGFVSHRGDMLDSVLVQTSEVSTGLSWKRCMAKICSKAVCHSIM